MIGAGPAGASASIFLSKYGIEHILIDREQFPRDKFCGEAFWGRARYVLDEMGAEVQTDMISKNLIKRGIEMTIRSVPSKGGITLQNPDFIRARRKDFDAYLLERAKQSPLMQFVQSHITRVENLNDKVLVHSQEYSIEAQLALVCIGEKQALLKQWLPSYRLGGRKVVAFRRYYKESEDKGVLVNFQKRAPNPTLLVNPLPQGMTLVEMYLYQSDFQKCGLKHEIVFDKLIKDSNLKDRFDSAEMLSDWQATSMSLRDLQPKLSVGRVLLAGASMGAIHPMLGKGVGLAMRSGQIAAFWVAQSIIEQNFTAKFLHNYDKEIRKRLGPDFTNAYAEYVAERVFHKIPILSFSPSLFALLLNLFGLSKLKVKAFNTYTIN